jgi:ribosomal peptide maturation radical SAM protein 1
VLLSPNHLELIIKVHMRLVLTDWTMHQQKKTVLLVALPFAGVTIPSIQLAVLEAYCRHKGISIETRHLYLKAAEIYGLQNYHSLIYPPNDSYTAQMAFSRYVFPEHWEKTKDRFKEFYTARAKESACSFDDYIHRTDILYHWIIDHVDWQSFDLIGFTLNYGQLLPSLAIAKKIKELDSTKTIVFGGSRTVGDLGVNVLRAFEYVDYIVSGDGEDALTSLASDDENHQSIPGLIYRDGTEVRWNTQEPEIDLNTLPTPTYDQFYKELRMTSPEIHQYYQYYGRLPLEITRGCWWNRCTFCNLNIQHHCYREKHPDRIINDIRALSERHHILDFQLIGNTLPKKDYRTLFGNLKSLGRDFSFFVETRAGQLTSQDYTLMKEAGFTHIQTGIESFSKNYLRKMNKGARVIDNIAALKFCKENGITNTYNLLIRYPSEEPTDYEETKTIAALLKGYLDAPQLCELRVMHGSAIHHHPEQFNIARFAPTTIDKIMYPPDYIDKGFTFVYDVTRKELRPDHPWESLIDEWKKEQDRTRNERNDPHTIGAHLNFYFVDGGTFIKVYDKRDTQNIKIFVLNTLERNVFLTCVDIISFTEIQRRCSELPEFELIAILQSFQQNGLVFTEDDDYVCLPLQSHVKHISEKDIECLVNITP